MAERDNGSGGPWWLKMAMNGGFAIVVSLYLLGMIPGVQSPFSQISAAISQHDQSSRWLLWQICRGTWKDNPVEQQACGKP